MKRHRVEIDGADVAFECREDEHLLTAIERAGWTIPASCRAGLCGTCEGQVLAGEFVLPGRQGSGDPYTAPLESVRLCHLQPRSQLLLRPRSIARLEPASERVLRTKVLRIERVASDVAILRLRFANGTRAKFKAGQYLKILLPSGEERAFSIASPPHQNDGLELHVRSQPGGVFSRLVFERLQVGDPVDVRLALGDFWLREDAGPRLFVAGGTGFAPVQSMLDHLQRSGAPGDVHVYVGARKTEGVYGQAAMRRWNAARPGWRIVPVVSEPSPADGWSGRTGFVHEAVLEDLERLDGYAVYACGPPAMVLAARTAFAARGVAPENFHSDAFAPSGEMR
jgi:NAD(P)H-flavin reductase/ferredoxin